MGNFVMAVAADGTVSVKPVVAGPEISATFRVVKSGPDAEDDMVVVNGLMRARARRQGHPANDRAQGARRISRDAGMPDAEPRRR